MSGRARDENGRLKASHRLVLFSGQAVPEAPQIVISASSIAEDASINDVVGILSVAHSEDVFTFTVALDADSKFQIANDDELQLSATLDYETKTSHNVTIEADNGVDTPLTWVFTIFVTNALEVTLAALTLNTSTIVENSAAATSVGALQSVSSGSTLSLVDDAGGRFALSGSNIVAGLVATDYESATSHNITVRETHPDGNNSPRDSVIAITVTEIGGEVATGLLVALGDSVTNSGTPTENYADDGAAALDPPLNFNNEGVDGSGAQDWLDDIATTLALFDAVPDDEPKIITVMLGNTLDHEGGSAGAILKAIELFDAIRRSSNNVKVVHVGDLSRGGGYDVTRATTNAWGAANVGLYHDAFIDMTNDVADGKAADGAYANATWYPTDQTHPGAPVHSAAALVYTADIDAVVAAFLSDAVAPTIVRYTPLDGASVLPEVTFTARFSKHVVFTGAVDIGIYRTSDDALIEAFDETDIGVGIEINGVDLTITPTSLLDDDAGYYVLIDASSIESVTGVAFAGITAKTTWNVTIPFLPDMTLDLKAYWELGEASGTRNDSKGSNHLTDNNTVTQNTGKVGNAAEFVAANSEYLDIADNADLGYSGDFSVAAWFYWSGSTPRTIASKGNDTFANNEWRMYVNFAASNNLAATLYRSGGGSTIAGVATALSTNTWYLGILTYNATSRVFTISLNAGTRVSATALADAPARKSQPFSIGRFGSNYFGGRIDQMGFWKRQITTDEEIWLYNSGNGRTYAEIAATAP